MVVVALVFILLLALLSMLIGAGHITIAEAWSYLLGNEQLHQDEQMNLVMQTLRWPRTLAAILVGLSLGIAGALLQTVTRNPLADTGLLGVNAGAALGVVIGITYLGAQTAWMYLLCSLCGTLIGTWLVLFVASTGNSTVTPLRLILAGVGIGATFYGCTSMILLSNQNTYDEFRYWVMGSLSGVNLQITQNMSPIVITGVAISLLLIKPLSALMLGDDVARSLGHRPGLTRMGTTMAVSLLTGTAVAIAGPIGFLGLVSPHIARSMTGHQIGKLIFMSGLCGALILLLADISSRLIIRPYETPVSVMITLLGSPLLIWIVHTNRMLTIRHMETR